MRSHNGYFLHWDYICHVTDAACDINSSKLSIAIIIIISLQHVKRKMKNVCPYICQGISLGVQLDDSMGCWEDWNRWVSNDGTMAGGRIERNRKKSELLLTALARIVVVNELKTGE